MVPGMLLIGLIAKGKHQFVQTGCVSVKGAAALNEKESIQSTHANDCFLHATVDQNTTVRYAYGAYGNGSGSVLQISVPVMVT